MEKNQEPARKKTVSTQFGLVVQIKWRVEIEYVSVLFMLVKPFVKFALRRFLLRWQPTERSDKGVGRCLSWRSRRARFYSFAVHLSRSQTTQLADCLWLLFNLSKKNRFNVLKFWKGALLHQSHLLSEILHTILTNFLTESKISFTNSILVLLNMF